MFNDDFHGSVYERPTRVKNLMANKNKDSFRTIITLMQLIGWHPKDKNSKFLLVQSYILYLFLMVIFTVLIIVDILIHKDYDVWQVAYVSENINYCFKVLPFLSRKQRKNISHCINYFNDQNFNPEDSTEMKLSGDCVQLCQNITKIFIGGVVVAALLYICPSVITKGYNLPMHIWLPYDPQSGPLVYYFSVFYITTACVYDTCATCLLDPLMGGLAYQAITQLKILEHRILNIQSYIDKSVPSTQNFDDRIQEHLKKCIKHHKAILMFLNSYENCFSWTMFSQLFGTTMAIGFCCIALTKLPLVGVETVKYALILLGASSQVLFYCFFGTLLYEENNNLITTIYKSKWYEYDIKTRKLLIMFMERTKQPMMLTAGKIIELSLDTFVIVLKRSYSLVAFLK